MAEILVTQGAHFVRGPAGHVHAADGVTDYTFWSRYLTVFDGLVVAARVRAVREEPSSLPRADGPGVRFHDLPDYLGPWQYLRRRRDLTGRLREAIARASAHCLRVPCAVGTLAWRELCRIGRPFGVEVMGDPWDSLAPGSVRTIVRPLARRWVARDLRGQCRTAQTPRYLSIAVVRHTLIVRFNRLEVRPNLVTYVAVPPASVATPPGGLPHSC